MENATKALLIAAAVLIAILIISFALIIYNMASETVGNVNLSEAEMTQFNSKFTTYEGTNVSGAQINALLTTVVTHNQQEANNNTKRFVSVTVNDPSITVNKDSVSVGTKAPTKNNYKVVCTLTNGLVTSINVTKK